MEQKSVNAIQKKVTRKFAATFEGFAAQHPNRPVPTRQMVYKLYKKFSETESVLDAHRSGRPTTVSTEENM